MYTVSVHYSVGSNFEQAARTAIRAEFEKNGYAPNAVLVLPGTTDLKNVAVGLGTPPAVTNIPVTVRDDLATGFAVKPGEFLLDICDPNSTLE